MRSKTVAVTLIPPEFCIRLKDFSTQLWKDFSTQLSFSLSFVVHLLIHVWLFVTLWTAAHQASLSFTISWSLLNLMSTESVMPSNHLMLCHPLLCPIQSFPALGSFPVSQLFPSGGQNIGASASNEYSGLISFRIDWFDLLAIQGTLKSIPPSPQFESISS